MGTPFGEINPIRLRKYRNYLDDGKSFAEFEHSEKDKVFVALIIGEEPKMIKAEEDCLDIESVILAMADHIKKTRGAAKKAVKKKAVKKAVKKKDCKKIPRKKRS